MGHRRPWTTGDLRRTLFLVTDGKTMAAFIGAVVLGGSNAVAIRLGNLELPPLWAAFLRFGLAALFFWGVAAIRRMPLPRGRALKGVVIFGLLNFAAAYALVYWALVSTPAGVAQVVLAITPLLTVLLAVTQGVEQLSLRKLAGAVIGAAGIAVVFADQLGAAVPLASLLALVGTALAVGQAAITIKRFPPVQPVVTNAIAMSVGAVVLMALSLGLGEPHSLPQQARTWASLLFLVVFGSMAVFVLVLYVLARWTASASSYMFLLLPLVAVAMGAWLAGEEVGPALVVGAAVVVAGVGLGITGQGGARAPRPADRLVRTKE